jgi:hypothetical protein
LEEAQRELASVLVSKVRIWGENRASSPTNYESRGGKGGILFSLLCEFYLKHVKRTVLFTTSWSVLALGKT